MTIGVQGVNIKQWMVDVNRFGTAIDSARVWGIIARDIDERFRLVENEIFTTEGGAGFHGRWPALSDKYRAWKEKHFPGRKIMVRTGRLKRALTKKGGEHIGFASKIASGWIVTLGADVETNEGFDYPEAHQKGTAAGGKVRRTVDPNRDASRAFIRVIHGEIVNQARGRTIFVDRITEALRQARLARWDIFRP